MTEAIDVQRAQRLREHCSECQGRGLVGGPDFAPCPQCYGKGFVFRGTHDPAGSLDADPTDRALAQVRAERAKLRYALERIAARLPPGTKDLLAIRMAHIACEALGRPPP